MIVVNNKQILVSCLNHGYCTMCLQGKCLSSDYCSAGTMWTCVCSVGTVWTCVRSVGTVWIYVRTVTTVQTYFAGS